MRESILAAEKRVPGPAACQNVAAQAYPNGGRSGRRVCRWCFYIEIIKREIQSRPYHKPDYRLRITVRKRLPFFYFQCPMLCNWTGRNYRTFSIRFIQLFMGDCSPGNSYQNGLGLLANKS